MDSGLTCVSLAALPAPSVLPPTSETSWRGNGEVPKRRKEVYLGVPALGGREGRDGMGATGIKGFGYQESPLIELTLLAKPQGLKIKGLLKAHLFVVWVAFR